MASNNPPSKEESSERINWKEVDTNTALELSRSTYEKDVLKQNTVAKQSHNADLFKTQQPVQGNKDGDVLFAVNFPKFTDLRSCNADFVNAIFRMSHKQFLDIGSNLLKERLESEAYQCRVTQALGPLPEGVKYVLDMSPSTEEDEYTVALQRLSLTTGVKLWYRSMTIGNVSAAVVAGHDDACGCNEKWDDPYLMEGPPDSIQGPNAIPGFNMAAYLFDTNSWAIEKYRDIDDFCPVRQGANVLRLLRSVVDNDLQIDSAPRLWTLVGLFCMFEMTNYDLIRDQVIAWFNDSNNFAFLELLPEETIRIATVVKAPALCEPAFRLLVNERALVIAGGTPTKSNKTVFGRQISDCLTGTEDMEKILQQIEHAGVDMAERYKRAIDNLCNARTLSLLGVREWEKLIDLGRIIPDGQSVTVSYNKLVALIRVEFRLAVEQIITTHLPTDVRVREKNENIEAALSYSVPKHDLDGDKSFQAVYNTLNKSQRALCTPVWLRLRSMTLSDFPGLDRIRRAAIAFSMDFEEARKQGSLYPGQYSPEFDDYDSKYWDNLFHHAIDQLQSYVEPLISRTDMDFHYSLTPHMVLCLNEEELGYCRYEDETAYEATIPEAELGPSGPGPAFHTGNTVLSATDSIIEDMEYLTVNSDDGGASTVVGSELAQDGISTVYDRHQVISQSVSLASERFTDDSMSADFAEAEVAVPMGNQMMHAQVSTLGSIDEDDIYGASDLESEVEFEIDDDTDDGDSDDADDAGDAGDAGEAGDANDSNDYNDSDVANVANVANDANDDDGVEKDNGANDNDGAHDFEDSDEDDDIEVISLPDSDVSGYL